MLHLRSFLRPLVVLLALSALVSSNLYAAKAKAKAKDEAPAKEESFLMADVGATVVLPSDWKMSKWADWEFKAMTEKNDMAAIVYMTPFQVMPTEEAAKAWAESYLPKLSEQKDVRITRTWVENLAGRPTAMVDIDFSFKDNDAAGVWRSAAFDGAGKVIHVYIEAAEKNDARARAALKMLVEKMVIGKPATPIDDLVSEAKTEAAFSVVPAAGWRKPVPLEMQKSEEIASKTGNDVIDYKKCVLEISPQAMADPDVALFCNIGWFLPPLDSHSWAPIEKEVYQKFFKSGGEGQVPHASKLELKDRLGFLYVPQTDAGFRMSVVPYDHGIVVGWGIASKGRTAQLDAAFREMTANLKFTGPSGGLQTYSTGQWIGYGLKYRPAHPLVWGPILLILGALSAGGYFLFRKPKLVTDY
jgi:hypothetical protein